MTSDFELSNAEARSIALAAQRFGRPRRSGGPTDDDISRLAADLGAVQIDAVNVLVRSHYLPFYSRLGPYDLRIVDRLAYQDRAVFEYWGHAASLLPVELHPALRWRMAGHAASKHWLAFQTRIEGERPGYLRAVEREIADRGPLAYTELTDPARREKVPTKYAESSLLWYRWSDGKTALEGLFDAGRLAVADRRGFERRYDLAERVIPAAVRSAPTLAEDAAQRVLVLAAARALGVAVLRDLADYFRIPVAATRARVRELVDSGELQQVRVAGWKQPGYLCATVDSKPVRARALISPFDSLIWERGRTERLFGFTQVFELYVKAAQRRYGYYVLPFLLGDQLVARVDLKADRGTRKLMVLGAFAEAGVSAAEVSRELSAELRDMTVWLGLDKIDIADRGDLAASLRRACTSGQR